MRPARPEKRHHPAWFSPLLAALLVACTQHSKAAAEFANYKLTSIDGRLSLEYAHDDDVTQGPTTPRIQHSLSDFRLNTLIMGHGHFYHPNFIAFDAGGGPVFEAMDRDDAGIYTSQTSTAYNLSLAARILSGKPYSGRIYYDHYTPSISSSTSIQNYAAEKYGFSIALAKPVAPVGLNLEAYQQTDSGRSATNVVDDSLQVVELRTSIPILSLGSSALSLQSSERTSRSGSTAQPIPSTVSSTRALTVDTQLTLGANRQTNVHSWLNYATQSYSQIAVPTPDTETLNFNIDETTFHNKELYTSANLNHSQNRLGNEDTTTQSMSGRAGWTIQKDLDIIGNLRASRSHARQFTTTDYAAQCDVRHAMPLPIGKLQTNYQGRYGQHHQNATGNVAVIGEQVIMDGFNPVPLSHPLVIPNSITVWNLARTQQYSQVSPADFTVTIVGQTTRIQLTTNSRIGATEEVLVDYFYDVGGTYDSTNLDQTLNVTWFINNKYSTYFRYTYNQPTVSAGTPTAQLNTVNAWLLGGRADVPVEILGEPYMLGGMGEHEDHKETLSPYVSNVAEAYVLTDLPGVRNASIRLNSRLTKIDAANAYLSTESVAHSFDINWRHYSGLRLALSMQNETNRANAVPSPTGDPLSQPAKRQSISLRANWQYRRLQMNGELSNEQSEQGAVKRSRTIGRLIVQRNF